MNRKGFTLIGILVYVVIVSLVTGLAITAYVHFNRVMKAQEHNLQEITDMIRVGDDLRTDIRGANTAYVSEAGDTLTLTFEDGRTRVYHLKKGRLLCLDVKTKKTHCLAGNAASLKIERSGLPGNSIIQVMCELQPRVPVKHDRRPVFVFAERLNAGGTYASQ